MLLLQQPPIPCHKAGSKQIRHGLQKGERRKTGQMEMALGTERRSSPAEAGPEMEAQQAKAAGEESGPALRLVQAHQLNVPDRPRASV